MYYAIYLKDRKIAEIDAPNKYVAWHKGRNHAKRLGFGLADDYNLAQDVKVVPLNK